MPKYAQTSGNPYVKAFSDALGAFRDFSTFLASPSERQNIRQGVMDAVNRGAVAGALGAPVDLTNAALNVGKAAVGYLGNKAGVLSADQMPQLIDNPVGGSEYIGNQMRRFGVVSPNRNALAEGLAGVLPLSPTNTGRAVAAIAGGGVVPGMDLAATVFHGSPHKFDRFDSSKIGTGEGAQAYGHGLYLADSPAVAGGYKEALSARVKDRLTVDGKVIDADSMFGRAVEDVPRIGLQATLQKIDDNIRFNEKYAPDMAEMYRGVRAKVAGLDPSRVAVKEGSLYKVDLPDEAIAKMLDYDNPVSEAQRVPLSQAALKQFGSGLTGTSGERLYKEVVFEFKNAGHPNPAQAATDWLRENGIPGIRYLDAGSRGQGQGTSNYVVFPGEENMLRILERNGQALK